MFANWIASIIIIELLAFASKIDRIMNSKTCGRASPAFGNPGIASSASIIARQTNIIILFPPKSGITNTFIVFPGPIVSRVTVCTFIRLVYTFGTVNVAIFTLYVAITPKLISKAFAESRIIIHLKIKDRLARSTSLGFITTSEAAGVTNFTIISQGIEIIPNLAEASSSS